MKPIDLETANMMVQTAQDNLNDISAQLRKLKYGEHVGGGSTLNTRYASSSYTSLAAALIRLECLAIKTQEKMSELGKFGLSNSELSDAIGKVICRLKMTDFKDYFVKEPVTSVSIGFITRKPTAFPNLHQGQYIIILHRSDTTASVITCAVHNQTPYIRASCTSSTIYTIPSEFVAKINLELPVKEIVMPAIMNVLQDTVREEFYKHLNDSQLPATNWTKEGIHYVEQ